MAKPWEYEVKTTPKAPNLNRVLEILIMAPNERSKFKSELEEQAELIDQAMIQADNLGADLLSIEITYQAQARMLGIEEWLFQARKEYIGD